MTLIRHWKMQDNAASTVVVDTIGAGNGTLNGGDNTNVVSVADGPGTALTRSFLLNGTDDYVSATATFLNSLSLYTVAFWAKQSAYAAANNALSFGNGNGVNIYPYDTNGGNGVRVFAFTLNTFNINASAPSADTWNHYALVCRSSTDAQLYVNASSVGTSASTHVMAGSGNSFMIGRFIASSAQWFGGRLCDVRFYDSDESANLSAIIAAKDTSTGGPFPHHTRRRMAGGMVPSRGGLI